MMIGDKVGKGANKNNEDNILSIYDDELEAKRIQFESQRPKVGFFRKIINNIIERFRSAKEFIHDHIRSLFGPEVNPIRHIAEPVLKQPLINNGIFERNVEIPKKGDPNWDDGATPLPQSTPTQYFPTREIQIPITSSSGKSPGILSTANRSEYSNNVESAREVEVESSLNITTVSKPLATEPSIGEISFQQYFKLFKEKNGAIEFTPGYVSFTPECLAYARQLAESAVGKNVSKMSKAEQINAAKALIEGDQSIRIAQENAAAREVRQQEKIKKQEIEKTKLPGQTDFEEFFAMYVEHQSKNSKFVIVTDSKFLAEDCLIYANKISREQPASDLANAAEYLSKWNAAAVEALKAAQASQIFQAPQPPAALPARVRPGTAQVLAPLPAWETVALDLQSLSDEKIGQLASITSTSSEKLNQVLKGLRLVSMASTKKDATIVEGGTGQRAGFRSRWPDSAPTAIDDLQQAQFWLKNNANNVEKQLDAYPNIKAILQSSQRISDVIDEQLSLLAPEPKKDTAKAVSRLPELTSLSNEETARAAKDFNTFVEVFTNANSNGRNYNLLPNSKYLTPACLAIANHIVDSPTSAQGLPQEANINRLLAAAYLVNAATKIQREKTQ